LKGAPDALKQLPEVVYADQLSACYGGSRALERLLRLVNSFPYLTTLGCGLELSPYGDRHLAYGYLDIARYPLVERSFATIKQRAQCLMAALCDSADPSVKFLLTIKVGIYELRPLFVLDVEAVGAGATAGEAFKCWETALDLLGNALRQIEND
jgi:hypothetical protein